MRIKLKNEEQVKILRKGGRILAKIMNEIQGMLKPGVSTFELNQEAERLAVMNKARPSFKGYTGGGGTPYPCALCVSLNDEVVHGIASKDKVLKNGDVVSLDMGIEYQGLFTDHAKTFAVGSVSREAAKLIRVTQKSLDKAIGYVREGVNLSQISKLIQEYVERNGFAVVRQLVGHGVGYAVHEEPPIPNYYSPGVYKEVVLKKGMVLAIEPMVTAGSWRVKTDQDQWTVRTADASLSAHFEHTVVVGRYGAEIMTRL